MTIQLNGPVVVQRLEVLAPNGENWADAIPRVLTDLDTEFERTIDELVRLLGNQNGRRVSLLQQRRLETLDLARPYFSQEMLSPRVPRGDHLDVWRLAWLAKISMTYAETLTDFVRGISTSALVNGPTDDPTGKQVIQSHRYINLIRAIHCLSAILTEMQGFYYQAGMAAGEEGPRSYRSGRWPHDFESASFVALQGFLPGPPGQLNSVLPTTAMGAATCARPYLESVVHREDFAAIMDAARPTAIQSTYRKIRGCLKTHLPRVGMATGGFSVFKVRKSSSRWASVDGFKVEAG